MMICDFLELFDGDNLQVMFINIKTKKHKIMMMKDFIDGECDESIDDIIFHEIYGWEFDYGYLVIKY